MKIVEKFRDGHFVCGGGMRLFRGNGVQSGEDGAVDGYGVIQESADNLAYA